MQFTNISEKELEKINLIFNLMNQISDIKSDQYIKSMMKRYELISKVVSLSVETIKKFYLKPKPIELLNKETILIKFFIMNHQFI